MGPKRIEGPGAVGYLYRLAHNLAMDWPRKRADRERYLQHLQRN